MADTTTTWVQLLQEPRTIILADVAVVLLLVTWWNRKQLTFILKSLSRNKFRTSLTSVAIVVLVFVVTLIWTVLYFLDMVTAEKSQDFRAIVTEKWQLPSQMPFAYAGSLSEGAAKRPGDVRPQDSVTWSFYGGTLDPAKR